MRTPRMGLEASQIFHEQLILTDIVVSCLNCGNFDANGEACLLYKTRPPAKVMVYGCASWEVLIPF